MCNKWLMALIIVLLGIYAGTAAGLLIVKPEETRACWSLLRAKTDQPKPADPVPQTETAKATPVEDSEAADSEEENGNTLDFNSFLSLKTNANCSHWDRGLGVEVEETTDFDFDPGKNTRMYIVKCEGYSKPLMTPLDDLSEGVPRSSLLEAPPLP